MVNSPPNHRAFPTIPGHRGRLALRRSDLSARQQPRGFGVLARQTLTLGGSGPALARKQHSSSRGVSY
jgi:hypothetical protein